MSTLLFFLCTHAVADTNQIDFYRNRHYADLAKSDSEVMTWHNGFEMPNGWYNSFERISRYKDIGDSNPHVFYQTNSDFDTANQNIEIVSDSVNAYFKNHSNLECVNPDIIFYFVDKAVHEQFLYKNDIFTGVNFHYVILCDNCGDKDKKVKVDQAVSKVASKECKSLDNK